ncbi:MAG: methionyl-tRNA formyltransferase, partial [bacterium]
GSLHDRLMIEGGHLIQSTIDLIAQNEIKTQPQPQNNTSLKKAPKLFKENCRISWNDNVSKAKQMIHGLSPYPGAWTELLVDGKKLSLKIFKVLAHQENHGEEFGTIKSTKKEIRIYASDGFLIVQELQLQGKRKMNAKDFLNGFSFSEGAKVL